MKLDLFTPKRLGLLSAALVAVPLVAYGAGSMNDNGAPPAPSSESGATRGGPSMGAPGTSGNGSSGTEMNNSGMTNAEHNGAMGSHGGMNATSGENGSTGGAMGNRGGMNQGGMKSGSMGGASTHHARAMTGHRSRSSAQVREVQQALNQNGASLQVDGVLGPDTRKALRNYQSQNGLRATGRIDAQTRQKLEASK